MPKHAVKAGHLVCGRWLVFRALLAGNQPLRWPGFTAQPAYKELITHTYAKLSQNLEYYVSQARRRVER